MLKKGILIFLIFVFLSGKAYSRGVVKNIFNLPSARTSGSGILLLDVGHRYFDVNRHTTNINITAGYGILDFVDVDAAYSFKNKDIILSSKVNILDDYSASNDILSLSVLSGAGYKDTNGINNSLSLSYFDDEGVESRSILRDEDKLSFFIQPVIQKHFFSNRLSIGAVPTFAYNTNFYNINSKHDYSIGMGIFCEFYIFDRLSLCGEIVMNYYGFAFKYMNYNAGIKYSGFRHTFSLWAGNSAGYSPVEYIVGNTSLISKFSFAFTREFDI